MGPRVILGWYGEEEISMRTRIRSPALPARPARRVSLYRLCYPGLPLCGLVNPLTPNDHYSGRTAPLTSKVAFYIFIQQI